MKNEKKQDKVRKIIDTDSRKEALLKRIGILQSDNYTLQNYVENFAVYATNFLHNLKTNFDWKIDASQMIASKLLEIYSQDALEDPSKTGSISSFKAQACSEYIINMCSFFEDFLHRSYKLLKVLEGASPHDLIYEKENGKLSYYLEEINNFTMNSNSKNDNGFKCMPDNDEFIKNVIHVRNLLVHAMGKINPFFYHKRDGRTDFLAFLLDNNLLGDKNIYSDGTEYLHKYLGFKDHNFDDFYETWLSLGFQAEQGESNFSKPEHEHFDQIVPSDSNDKQCRIAHLGTAPTRKDYDSLYGTILKYINNVPGEYFFSTEECKILLDCVIRTTDKKYNLLNKIPLLKKFTDSGLSDWGFLEILIEDYVKINPIFKETVEYKMIKEINDSLQIFYILDSDGYYISLNKDFCSAVHDRISNLTQFILNNIENNVYNLQTYKENMFKEMPCESKTVQ